MGVVTERLVLPEIKVALCLIFSASIRRRRTTPAAMQKIYAAPIPNSPKNTNTNKHKFTNEPLLTITTSMTKEEVGVVE
jgi:hypothetical protein